MSDSAAIAAARASAYAALSTLAASPADGAAEAEPWLATTRARAEFTVAARALAAELAAHYASDAQPLPDCDAAPRDAAAWERHVAAYSALFEVGERGPPLPIREELAPGTGAAAKEEVARFYEHFGYELGAPMAWQPDHVSVLLEFVHYLAWREADAGDDESRMGLALAQRDFVKRHVLNWLPAVADQLRGADAAPWLRQLFAGIVAFARADLAHLDSICAGADARAAEA